MEGTDALAGADVAGAAGRGGRELATRVAVGAGLAVVALGATWFNKWTFTALIMVISAVAGDEWATMHDVKLRVNRNGLTLLIPTLIFIGIRFLWIGSFFILIQTAIAMRFKKDQPDVANGLLYIGLPSFSLVWLRGEPAGLSLILLTFAVVWSADIAAYAVGRTVGGPKLWQSVSPNKTWAGFAGACLAASAAAVAVGPYVHVAPLRAAIAGLLLGALAQGGDLFESALKRRAGVKDSGTLLPGHGGVLDRLDSLIPVAPAVAGAVALGWL